jgi:hypothetical protein
MYRIIGAFMIHLDMKLPYSYSVIFFFLWRYSPHLGHGLPPWNFPFHFSLLDLGHSVGLLGRVISSSQGPYSVITTIKSKARFTFCVYILHYFLFYIDITLTELRMLWRLFPHKISTSCKNMLVLFSPQICMTFMFFLFFLLVGWD